jgi:hypothetical protein
MARTVTDLDNVAFAQAQLTMLGHYLEQRDQIVVDAYHSGVRKIEIHQLTGLNRETIKRIIDTAERRAVSTATTTGTLAV